MTFLSVKGAYRHPLITFQTIVEEVKLNLEILFFYRNKYNIG